MAKVKKLDKHLMNMIAAGEVVERPAGIVKELIDNAIDAKASVIEINVEEGGIDLIRIIDNGEGMSKADAILAFERHATSKIEKESDLWSIDTLGFRGEALPSIASVAKVNLVTNDKKESTKISVEYGEVKESQITAANAGTSISVSGLFHKTPARLKNFSSVNYEMAIITSNVEKFAIAYPQISFILKHNEKEVFKTAGNNNLLEVIYQMYGRDIAKDSILFENKDFDFEISGLLTLPQHSRSNRHHIMIFINDRMIKSYKLSNQVIKGYQKFIFSNRFPIAVIKIKMDPKLVDVNVHPSKWEVKVAKEKQLNNLLSTTVEKVLQKNMQAPKVRQVNKEKKVEQKSLNLNKVDNSQKFQQQKVVAETLEDEDIIYNNFENKVKENNDKETTDYKEKELFPSLDLIGQMHGKYILAQDETSLYIIDQHAAEERVNFEKISFKLKNNIIEKSPLLLPENIKVKQSMMPYIKEVIEKLETIGISSEVFGNNSIVIREVPLWLINKDIKSFVVNLLDAFLEDRQVDVNSLREDEIATMACHSSIRFNRTLSKEEMQQVLNNLQQAKQPYHCPHGRPTLIKISEKQLVKEFLR